MVKELKHTEIGDIPVDWELQTFDETFRVISNNTLSRENLNNRGGAVRNIHYGDILTKFPEVLDCNEEEIPYVNELSLLSSSTQLLQDGDIVVADTAEDETVGKVIEVQNLGDSKLVAGLHTIPCRVKKGDFAPGWLGYYMNSDLFHNQILPYITGIKVSSISKGAISETLILVPPFDEQEKIVQSLNKIQLLMTSETKVVNKIKLVKNGCLSKMFPQKDDTVPEMRLPGFTEAWEQRKLGEVLSLLKDGTHGTHQDAEEGPYLLSAKNIKNGQIIIDDSSDRKISEDEFNQIHTKFTLENGDILLTIVGSIGESAILENVGKFTFQRSVAFLRPSEEMTSRFLKTEIESVQFQKELNDRKSQSAQPGVYLGDLSKIPIYITSKEEQKKIGECFSNLDHLITLHQRKYDKLVVIKKSMLEKMFPKNGQTKPEIRFSGFTDDWEQRKLGDVANFLDTIRKPLEGAKRIPGPYPYYGASGIVDFVDGYLFDEELVLLSEDGANITDRNYPVCFLATGKYWVNNHAHVLKIKGGNENNFVCNSLEQKDYKKYNSGMAMPKLNQEICREIPILCPNYNEQKKIGDFFRNLDNLITLHQRELEKLKKIKLSMLEKMFV